MKAPIRTAAVRYNLPLAALPVIVVEAAVRGISVKQFGAEVARRLERSMCGRRVLPALPRDVADRLAACWNADRLGPAEVLHYIAWISPDAKALLAREAARRGCSLAAAASHVLKGSLKGQFPRQVADRIRELADALREDPGNDGLPESCLDALLRLRAAMAAVEGGPQRRCKPGHRWRKKRLLSPPRVAGGVADAAE